MQRKDEQLAPRNGSRSHRGSITAAPHEMHAVVNRVSMGPRFALGAISGGMGGGLDPWELLLAHQQRPVPITEVRSASALHKLSGRGPEGVSDAV